eukprot:6468680-Amphidinium_carterae.1
MRRVKVALCKTWNQIAVTKTHLTSKSQSKPFMPNKSLRMNSSHHAMQHATCCTCAAACFASSKLIGCAIPQLQKRHRTGQVSVSNRPQFRQMKCTLQQLMI